MKRRDFVKTGCALMGVGVLGSITATSCSSIPVVSVNKSTPEISVPLEKFNASNRVIVRPDWLNYDILVVKKDNNTFTALYMRCTHEDHYLTASSSGLFCPAHGSAFNLEGEVTKAPATMPLRTFPTESNQNSLIIKLKS